MIYSKPKYLKEVFETKDVLLASGIDLGNGTTLIQINEETAQVGASALDVLGLR